MRLAEQVVFPDTCLPDPVPQCPRQSPAGGTICHLVDPEKSPSLGRDLRAGSAAALRAAAAIVAEPAAESKQNDDPDRRVPTAVLASRLS